MKQNSVHTFKRLSLVLVMGALLVLGLAAQAAGAPVPKNVADELQAGGFETCASNGEIQMFFNKETGFIAFWSAQEQKIWYSSPLSWEDDPLAAGANRMALGSALAYRKADSRGTMQPVNSIVNSVRREGLTLEQIPNGVRLNYDFPRDEIFIPVEYILDGSSVLVRVPLKDVKEPPKDSEDNKYIMNRINLMPYFGAQVMGTKGFMVVPDGSGALINFDNKRSTEMIELPVYGADPSIDIQMKRDVKQVITLPVFGLSAGDAAFIGVIEDGAGRALINAETSSQRCSYNAVSATYIFRDLDVVSVAERVGTNRDMRLFDKRLPDDEYFAVRYIFLPKDKSSYTDMALAYQKYLADKSQIKKSAGAENNPFFMGFFGGAVQVKPILGIPMEVTTDYTTFEDAQKILQKLKDEGVKDIVVNYKSWFSGGEEKDFPATLGAEGSLGGDYGFNNLAAWAKSQDIKLFAEADLVKLYRSTLTFMKELVAARRIFNSNVEVYYYKSSTFDKDKRYDPVALLRPSEVLKAVERFLEHFQRYNDVGVSLSSMGNTVYSDFDEKQGTGRNKVVATYQQALNNVAKDHSVLLDAPLAYALGASDYVIGLPSISSRYDIVDESIPFYQIALRGYIPYAIEAGNTSTSIKNWELRCLEFGASPYFNLIAKNVKELAETRFRYLFDRNADVWMNDVVTTGKEIQKVLETVKGQSITAHRIISHNVRVTTYSNGYSIAVNYGTKPVLLDGNLTVPAQAYIVFRGSK